MNYIQSAFSWLANLRHQGYRRRLIERTLRRFTSRTKAMRIARFIP